MNNYSGKPLRIGFLGMSDNFATITLLLELKKLGCEPDAIFLVNADLKTNINRFFRKIKTAGCLRTLKRVLYAFFNKNIKKADDNIIVIKNVNSSDCRSKIKSANLDLLLLCVDCIVGRGTFSLPRIGTLNAHPGWVPSYRGLGSTLAMLRDDFLPAISVHLVDEGIDTGPLILRRTIEKNAAKPNKEGEISTLTLQAKMFCEVISMYRDKEVKYIDTFLESSNMTRGISTKKASEIYSKLSNFKKNIERR